MNFKTPLDNHIYIVISEILGSEKTELLNVLLNKTYQQGKEDLASELKPDVIIKYGIFSNSREKGIEKIKELVGNKPKIIERYGKHEVFVKTIDSEYKLLPFNDSARGHKLHYAYVDKNLLQSEKDVEMLKCRVMPMLVLADIHFGNEDGYSYKNHLIYY